MIDFYHVTNPIFGNQEVFPFFTPVTVPKNTDPYISEIPFPYAILICKKDACLSSFFLTFHLGIDKLKGELHP